MGAGDLLTAASQVIFLIATIPIWRDRNPSLNALMAASFAIAYMLLAVGMFLTGATLSTLIAFIGAIDWCLLFLVRFG